MAFQDDIVARATRDLQRAEREVAVSRERMEGFEREAADLRAFLRKLEFYAGPVQQDQRVATVPAKQIINERPPAREGTKSRRLVDAAISQIVSHGRRLDIQYLLERLLESGFEIGGKDEKSNLAGYLSRDARVDFVHGLGWGLKEEGAVPEPASQEAAPSMATGGSNETTLDHPGTESPRQLSVFAGAERAP